MFLKKETRRLASLRFLAKHQGHLGNCGAVVARFRCSEVHARWVAHHGLSPSKCPASRSGHAELMSHRRQFASDVFRNERLDADVTTFERVFGEASCL